MSQALSNKLEVRSSGHWVDEYFICLSSKGNKFATWADLDRQNFVGVVDLRNWLWFITVPEINRCSLSTGDQLKLIIFPLRHAKERSILSLIASHSLFLLQIIGGDSTILGARVYQMRMVQIWEQAHDVFLLI